MDFSRTEDQQQLRQSAVAFARQALAGDDPATFRERWRRCADFGVQGLTIPEAFGGGGLDLITAIGVLEGLGYGCRDQGLLFSLHAQLWSVEMPILRFGSDQQKKRYLPALCRGSIIGSHCMTEPGSGSDAFSLRCRATRREGRYVLSGAKTFATNAPEADVFVVFATLDPSMGIWGITAFLVDAPSPGLKVGRHIEKMGLTSSPTAEVFFDECEVPMENRLGLEGQGTVIFNHSMAWERTCILASTVGNMEYQLERCVQYATERRQFGRAVGDFQLVASRLAEMKVRLEAARLLLYRGAFAHATGEDVAVHGAISKLFISEAAVQSAIDAVQVLGGYGYTREYLLEQDVRDALGSRIYSGTTEIQRLLIARALGLNPD
jgi:alkylation response protein AidB-like acyl-CoA dehydrogenase